MGIAKHLFLHASIILSPLHFLFNVPNALNNSELGTIVFVFYE